MRRLLLALLLTPAAAQADDFVFAPNLLQADFRAIAEDVTRGLAYKSVGPAEAGGITGFSLGTLFTYAPTENPDSWQRATGEKVSAVGMAGLAGFENDAAGRLPMGLRQRLALGCALVHRPQVLFLDEPTSGVDPIGRRVFWDILFHLSRNEGVAILVTTHYMSEAEHCDHLALMFAGKVVADASPEAMKEAVVREAGQLLELRVDRPAPAQAALRAAGYASAALHGRAVHLLSQDVDGDRTRLPALLASAGVAVQSVVLRPLSMEDVFVQRVTALEDAQRRTP